MSLSMSPGSQPQSSQPSVKSTDLIVLNDDNIDHTSALSIIPVTSSLSPFFFSPPHSGLLPSTDGDSLGGASGKLQEDTKVKSDHNEDSQVPSENILGLAKCSHGEAEAETITEKKRDLGGWSGELEVKAEPFDIDSLVRAPGDEFERDHRTFQEDVMSELYLLVLECELWSKEYNQRLVREREEEIAQKTAFIRAKEQKQEKSRLSLLKFMTQVRSAMSALVEAIPQSPESRLDMEG